MMRQKWYKLTRYLLVGMLVATMTVDCAATIRLFRKRCNDCVCRPTCCKTKCRKKVCRKKCAKKHSCAPVHTPCHTCEPVADTTCHSCVPAAHTEWMTGEGHIVPSPAPAEMYVPQVVEQDPIDESMFEPVEPPASETVIPPAPVAVPDTITIPAETSPTPSLIGPPAAGIVGDRYANEGDPVEPLVPAEDSTPAPVSDPTPAEDPLDIFGDPTPTVEAPAPAEDTPPEPEASEPADPAPQPELDDEGLFGPEESSDDESSNTEEPDEKPADTQQPEPAEPEAEKIYDPFGVNLLSPQDETAILSAAGGLHSNEDRTWTDNTATFSCEAHLVHVTAKSVVLHRDNGAKLVVPYARLGQADLQFVQQQVIALRVVRARESAAEKLAVAWAH